MATYWVNSAATPSAPYNSVSTAATSIGNLVAYITGVGGPGWDTSDKILVLNTHAPASYGTAQTWAFPEDSIVPILAVDSSGNLMPTAGNTSKPQESTGAFGGANISITGNAFWSGIWLAVGRGSNVSGSFNIGTSATINTTQIFSNCLLELGTTSVQARITMGAQSAAIKAQNFITRNTAFRFSASAQRVLMANGRHEHLNGLLNGGTTPTSVFELVNAKAYIFGGAYSPTTSLVAAESEDPGECDVAHVYLPSGVTPFSGNFDLQTTYGGPRLRAWAYGNTAANYNAYMRNSQGVVDVVTDRYLSAAVGQLDGAGSSVYPTLRMTPVANPDQVSIYRPLVTDWIPVRIASTGSKTVSMKVAYDSTTTLGQADLWLEVQYMGNEALDASPDMAFRYSNPVSTLQQVASATSTVVRNTQGSNTALSTTTDSWTGSFTNLKRHTLSASITADVVGYARVRVCYGKTTPTPIYVCPDVTVS